MSKKKSWVDLNNAIANDPTNAWLYLQRGAAEIGAFEDRKAMLDYNKAIELSPKLMYAYLKRGDALTHLGEFKKAESDYDHALQLASASHDPNEVSYAGDIALRLSERYQARGDKEAAVQVWKRVVNLKNSPKDLIRKGKCELALSRLDAARADLASGLKGRPSDTDAMAMLGECLQKQGKYLEAIAEYSKAITEIKRTDNSFVIRNRSLLWENRAKCYSKIGKEDLAARDRASLSASRDSFFEVVPFRDNRIDGR